MYLVTHFSSDSIIAKEIESIDDDVINNIEIYNSEGTPVIIVIDLEDLESLGIELSNVKVANQEGITEEDSEDEF